MCVRACVQCSGEQLSEMGKARGINGVVRNAYRLWSENIQGHIRNLSLSGRMLIHVHMRTRIHTLGINQYTVNISYNEFAKVEGIRLIYQDKNIKV